MRPILAKTFVFTSCVHPEQWYVTALGSTEPEWARRLRDFAEIISVEPHHLQDALQAATARTAVVGVAAQPSIA